MFLRRALLSAILLSTCVRAASGQTCTFDWTPHYEQLTRLTDEYIPTLGDGDSKTVPIWESTTGATGQLQETWYVARRGATDCPVGTDELYRTYSSSLLNYRDAPVENDAAGYTTDAVLGCPWTGWLRSG
jgi:hypothetical protein